MERYRGDMLISKQIDNDNGVMDTCLVASGKNWKVINKHMKPYVCFVIVRIFRLLTNTTCIPMHLAHDAIKGSKKNYKSN